MPAGIYPRKSGITGSPSYTKTCAVCGIEFKAYSSLSRVKHCSKRCGYEAKKRRFTEIRQCARCGAEFKKTRSDPQLYCSPTCRNRASNDKRSSHAMDWRPQHRSGYMIRADGKGGTLLQHRVVMEQILGRPLTKYENVHHKNGVRDDNRPENLEVWVVRQPQGARVPDIIEWATVFLRSQGFVVTAPEDAKDRLQQNSSPETAECVPVNHTLS